MISYSTNWMGPVSMHWYEENVPMVDIERVHSKWIYPEKEGQTYTAREPSVNYAGGRIDIRGLEGDDYWCGQHEYGVSIMTQKSWNKLSSWCRAFESETLLTYDQLIENFENDTNYKIEWFKNDIT